MINKIEENVFINVDEFIDKSRRETVNVYWFSNLAGTRRVYGVSVRGGSISIMIENLYRIDLEIEEILINQIEHVITGIRNGDYR